MFKSSLFLYFIVNALSCLTSAYRFIDCVNFINHDNLECCLCSLRDIKVTVDLIISDLDEGSGCNEVQDKNKQ